jgi:hypothetical protein
VIVYTVRCRFDDGSVADRWAKWLVETHLADVCAAGALAAELVRLDGDPIVLEARYRFESREAFARYEREEAPRLRAEGLALFPIALGLHYERSLAELVGAHPPR